MHPQDAKMTGKQCLMKKNKIHIYACCQDRILQALNLWTMNISLHTKISVHFVFKKTLIFREKIGFYLHGKTMISS